MGRYTMGDTVRDVIISSYCSYPIKSSSQKYKIKKCAAAFGAAHFFLGLRGHAPRCLMFRETVGWYSCPPTRLQFLIAALYWKRLPAGRDPLSC